MRHILLHRIFVAVFFMFSAASALVAGTTGKISGKVIDSSTKEPLIGVNVLIEGTYLGAASDVNGNYMILNVPPGAYTLKASAIGYTSSRVVDVRVFIDLTTKINFELGEVTLELGEEVVVVAERPLVQRDLTSTSVRITAQQIEAFPIEDVDGLVNLQAGVVEGHFRGGRSGEVLYLIDGIPVTDYYSGDAGVTAENHSLQELEIISGTFNAEYGEAMSGVVNQVTKDGGQKLAGGLSFYAGDYLSSDDDLFMNIDEVQPNDVYNIQGSLSGPVIGLSTVTFFASGRIYRDDGYLYGQRIFLPTDLSDFTSDDSTEWQIGATGDGEFVPMKSEKRTTFQGKLTIRIFGSDKLRFQALHQRRDWRDFDNDEHRYRLNPDGALKHFARGTLASIGYTNVLSPSAFLELHGAWFSNREDSYVFEDPRDPRFPDFRGSLAVSGPAFFTGGAEDLHLHRESRYLTLKADLVAQITQEHQIKTGVEAKRHRVWIHNFGIQNDFFTNFTPQPVEFGRSEFAHMILRPEQYAAYIQDKMEFDYLVVNAGIRFDYFDSKGNVLIEQLKLGRPLTVRPSVSENQISPRIGLAFPITDRGVLHLSYGHFFQVPQFDLLYLNPAYNINATERFQVGNPGLKSQRTVAYELGLQQQLTEDIAVDVTSYYKDIRNLIATEIFDIGNGNKYSQYINRDYGNTRGIIVSLEKRHSHGFAATADYTFQIARGNASDPNSVFLDNETDPPRASQKQLAPLDWDRRHSLNVTTTIGELGNYAITIIGKLGSGLPYTPAFQNQRTGLLNSESKPRGVTVDIYASKSLNLASYRFTLFTKIFNVFDARNERDVFTDTGRANYSLEAIFSGRPRGVNTIEEFFRRPDFFSAPRQVVVGLDFSF